MVLSLLVALTLLTQVQGPEAALPRQPRQGGVYVVAHRGVHEGIPENTLAAYRKAIDLGADFVEVDLRETADGRIVSIHNHTVDAYAAADVGPVNSFTLEELKAMDIGSRVGPEWANERIPAFEEILELCKGKIGIYLDLKQGDVEKIVGLVRRYGMERDVLWYAGVPQLRQVRDACPECILMPDPGAESNLARLLDLFSPKAVASTWSHASRSFADACRAANALLLVDDDGPETWNDLLNWGVAGIQTDHVEALIERLRQSETPVSDK